MKNKKLVSLLVALIMLVTMTQSALAAQRYYKITYAPGILATFKDSLVNEYKEKYGTQNVVQSSVTGAITITVAAKQDMPNAPTANDIEYKKSESATQYYVLTNGWQPASTRVTENATYVVQYGALLNGVEYTIRYVDKTSNIDLETPVIARSNGGQTLIAYAKVLDGYTFDSQSKSMTLSQDGSKNIITFYYTNTNSTSNETQVIENVVTNVVTPTNPVNPTIPRQPTVPDVTVPDNQTPQSNGGNNETVNIEDNQTPQSKGELAQNNQQLYIAIGGIMVLLVVVCGYVMIRRKNKEA